MPKVKTNSSAKKRFKVTGTGKITHQKSFKRHILTKKSKKRKRKMRIDGMVAKIKYGFCKTPVETQVSNQVSTLNKQLEPFLKLIT